MVAADRKWLSTPSYSWLFDNRLHPRQPKQWVNAVANLRGRDPQTNQEKLAELRDIEAGHANDGSKLIFGARAAWHLHVNADQSQLMRREFDLYFSATVIFADEMSAIYHSTQQDQ